MSIRCSHFNVMSWIVCVCVTYHTLNSQHLHEFIQCLTLTLIGKHVRCVVRSDWIFLYINAPQLVLPLFYYYRHSVQIFHAMVSYVWRNEVECEWYRVEYCMSLMRIPTSMWWDMRQRLIWREMRKSIIHTILSTHISVWFFIGDKWNANVAMKKHSPWNELPTASGADKTFQFKKF